MCAKRQLALPSWLKSTVIGTERRLDKNDGENTRTWFFNDETAESTLMRGHLFYLLLVVMLMLCARGLLNAVYFSKGWKLQPMFCAPGVEFQVFLALLIVGGSQSFRNYKIGALSFTLCLLLVYIQGMLDVSAQVLASETQHHVGNWSQRWKSSSLLASSLCLWPKQGSLCAF